MMPAGGNHNSNHLSRHTVERLISWIGSRSSLIAHSVAFVLFFALSSLGFVSWSLMLLILTTIVSLEAIYLAIFIQMTVNRQAASLKEVGEDVEVIQETVEELGEGVEDIQDTVEEMTEDEQADAEREHRQAVTLESLTADVKRVLTDLEALKQGSRRSDTPAS